MNSTVRITIALVLQFVAVLLSLSGWIDALEGGAAVMGAGIIVAIVWLIGRVRIPRLTWISTIATFLFAIITIVVAVNEWDPVHQTGTVNGLASAMNWVYRAGAIAVMSGMVFYVIKIWQALNAAKSAGDK